MYEIDFSKPEHVHFIGIGGISMSGLAEILLDEGFTVSGSDAHETDLTRHLEQKEIRQYEMENFLLMYQAYKAMHGNSFIDEIHEEVTSWKIIT